MASPSAPILFLHRTYTSEVKIRAVLKECQGQYSVLRPTLKSCLFAIHRPGKKKKKVTSRQQVELFFFQSLCLERYMIKRFKKISS